MTGSKTDSVLLLEKFKLLARAETLQTGAEVELRGVGLLLIESGSLRSLAELPQISNGAPCNATKQAI